MFSFHLVCLYSILTEVYSILDTNILDIKVDCSLQQFWQKDAAKENKNCDAINAPVYHCAWDIFTLQYEEICRSKPILIRKGNRPTIQGGLHYGRCPPDRYQPFHIVSNLTVGCALQKTNCSGEGQVVYEDNDPKRDTTCRCDYTKGYDFVLPPRNNCFCIPSEEDCSCYIKTCMNMSDVLDPEYNCVDEYDRQSYENNTNCLPIQLRKGASTKNDNTTHSTFLNNVSGYDGHSGDAAGGIILILLAGILVICISYKLVPRIVTGKGIKSINEDSEEKKKNIEEKTEKRIEKHKLDETFYASTDIKKGIELLDSFYILVLLGTEKCGKTKSCLQLCTYFKEKHFHVIYMTPSDIHEFGNISFLIDIDKNELYVFDINMKPSEEDNYKELIEIANLYASPNIRFIFTIKMSAVKKSLGGFLEKQQVEIDSSNKDDKRGILMNHMKHNNIVVCKSYRDANYEYSGKLKKGEQITIPQKVIEDIVKAETTGQFPELCKSFCSTPLLLPLEDRYFKNPPQSLVDDIHKLRLKDQDLYVALAYVLIEDTMGNELKIETIDNVCDKMGIATDKYKKYQIKDSAKELKNEYTYLIEKGGLFMFSSDMIKKAVWISYIDVDAEYCVMNCQWEYVTDLLRPRSWAAQENDVCLEVNTSVLIKRLNSEMKDIGSAWSVGTYLRKLSERGKDLTDSFCDCMRTEKLKNKTDILISFFNGISDLGNDVKVFNFSKSIKDTVIWPHLDNNDNSILHFCIMQNFEFMCYDISMEFREAFINMENRRKYSPCALAIYFGRSKILERINDQIPEEYEYYKVLKHMFSHGEKNAGKNIKSNDLNFLAMDLPLNLVENVKFGKRQEYHTINHILVSLKNKTMILIRIQGLPPKVKNKEVKETLSSFDCVVLNVYPEKYREKGDLTDIDTGDFIAVCKFTNKSLPSELTIKEHHVTTEIMMRIKISKLPSYIKDYQIHNALSLQKCTVKELFPEMKQATGGKLIDYIAVCSPIENTLPPKIHIDQYDYDTSVMTTVRFKNLPKQINSSEIENLLRQHHYDVDNTYREKRRKEGKLTNIKTGDRIAICKPFAHHIPPSLAFGNLPERYKIQRE